MTRYQHVGTDDEAATRDEIVEAEALRFHMEGGHECRFATCKRDCWAQAETFFEAARDKRELVPIIEDF